MPGVKHARRMMANSATVEASTLFRCGVLIDGSGGDALTDMAMHVQGERIVGLEPWRDGLDEGNDHERFVDLSECTVIPGLIDAHAHLCLGAPGSRGWTRAATDDVGIVMWGQAAATASLLTGVTTVVDVGSPRGLAIRLRDLLADGLAAGSRVFAAGSPITTTAGHGFEMGTFADSTAELVSSVRRTLAAGADLIKIMVTGGATDPSTNRRRAQYSEKQLSAGIADAHRLGMRVVGHANATEGITRAVNAGIDIVAHCNWLGREAGTLDVDRETVQTMARRQTSIDLNIQGALRDLAETDGVLLSWPYSTPEPTTRWELLQPLRVEGIPLYLTSDAFGPGVGAFTDSLTQLRSRWGLTAEELVSLVTSAPARALGIDDDYGRLAGGATADILVLPGDYRTDLTALLRPRYVYVDGKLVAADGRLVPPTASLSASTEQAAQQQLLDTVFQELV
jgi:imidazolonepropionase-like amidohydrolase